MTAKDWIKTFVSMFFGLLVIGGAVVGIVLDNLGINLSTMLISAIYFYHIDKGVD